MQCGMQHTMVSERGMVRRVQRGVHGEGGAAWGAAGRLDADVVEVCPVAELGLALVKEGEEDH